MRPLGSPDDRREIPLCDPGRDRDHDRVRRSQGTPRTPWGTCIHLADPTHRDHRSREPHAGPVTERWCLHVSRRQLLSSVHTGTGADTVSPWLHLGILIRGLWHRGYAASRIAAARSLQRYDGMSLSRPSVHCTVCAMSEPAEL